MNTVRRKLTLCADDFAQSEQISSGILELIASRRLTATSVMSQAPYWPTAARRLMPLQRLADVGLHLNLTHAFPMGNVTRPLFYWLLCSQLRLVSRAWLCKQFCEQIDLFQQHFGRLPDFIDGHQHLHAFPVLRAALTDAIAATWPQNHPLPWLRAPEHAMDGGDSPFKAVILRWSCRGFARHAQEHGLRVAPYFGGVYSLQTAADFPRQMRHWLQSAADGTLLMCHPGRPAVDHTDPICDARALEFHYLGSPEFADDCRNANIELTRFDNTKSELSGPVRFGDVRQ